MKEVALPTGAKLRITIAPFEHGKNLYQILASELSGVSIERFALNDDIPANMVKNIICAILASKKIEQALKPCMERCLYNDNKISSDTWEPVEARPDFIPACVEVARENVLPFMSGLSQQYQAIFQMLLEMSSQEQSSNPIPTIS